MAKLKSAGVPILQLESGIPVTVRGSKDPVFDAALVTLLEKMKVTQSFVVPMNKRSATKKTIERQFEKYHVKSAIINPDKKFARFWRVK